MPDSFPGEDAELGLGAPGELPRQGISLPVAISTISKVPTSRR